MEFRRGKVLGLVALLAISGCSTYQSEKADLLRGGGKSHRLNEAKNRLEDARATQGGLKEEEIMAREELGALEEELKAVNRNRAMQEGRLAAAREAAKISEAQDARLRRQLDDQTAAFNGKALELESAQMGGSPDEVQQKRAELKRLKRDLANTNHQIDILSQ